MRLKIRNRNKAIKKLTNVELSLYVYIVRRQNHKGLIQNLNISNAKDSIGHSRQGLYNALYALEEKGFIHIDYFNNVNFNIIVINNSFDAINITDNKNVDPYINMNVGVFENGVFYSSNIYVKRFILKFMGFKGRVTLTIDTLKKYNVYQFMDNLKCLFKIFTKPNGTKVFSKLEKIFGTDHNIQYQYVRHIVLNFIKKWGIPFNDQDEQTKDFKGIINVISNNLNQPIRIKRALNRLKKAKNWINGAYFNTIFYSSEPTK